MNLDPRHLESARELILEARRLRAAGRSVEASAAYERAGYHLRAGQQVEAAARAFLQAGRRDLAAQARLEAGDPLGAAEIWAEIDPLRAADVFQAQRRFDDAATCLTRVGEHRRAAVLWAKAGATTKAARALVRARAPDEALQLLVGHIDLPDAPQVVAEALDGGAAWGPVSEQLVTEVLSGRTLADATWWVRVALVLERSGRLDLALAAWDRAAADPRHAETATQARKRIRQHEEEARPSLSGVTDGAETAALGLAPTGGGTVESWAGRTIAGRYVLQRVLGRGATGVVYGARQIVLEREVAVKVHDRSDGTGAERFLREARASTRVDHPHIVKVFDAGLEPGLGPYLVMERLDGPTLAALLQGRWPAPGWSVELVTQVLSALEEAHGCGILHRDVKPANIMVVNHQGSRVFAKVVDFGIAQALDGHTTLFGADTGEGAVQGTPLYMAPEQVEGRVLDVRADLYAAGTVLYQLLTGRMPHTAGTIMALLHQKVHHDPRPVALLRNGRAVPPALRDLIMASVARRPEHRPGSAAELRQALLPFMHDARLGT